MVLTVDPSSQLTRGSILGDKTRMQELAHNPLAFIRPTPAGETLGGIANRTRETMLLCEAAGFEVILIETVGVGQSEIAVKKMVDFFLLLMLAGAGDELQGIKKGIMEMADGVVITKADGDNSKAASRAKSDYQQALHLQQAPASGWQPKVLTASALHGIGMDETWSMIKAYEEQMIISGFFSNNRKQQNIAWFQLYTKHLLQLDFNSFAKLQPIAHQLEIEVGEQKISVFGAAEKLLTSYHQSIADSKS